MTEPFRLLILDTYGVLFLRSPRYLEEPLVDEADEATREAVNEAQIWSRFAREHRLSAADLAYVRGRLAAKFCKNLNVWKELPGWRRDYRIAVLHGGPATLLDAWQVEHELGRQVDQALSAGALGLARADPALYTRIAADAGMSPGCCLLIDDERAPVLAARDAGMGAYRFGTVFGLRAVLAQPGLAFESSGPPSPGASPASSG
jgi:FMN phosphatase YigB (HAD superfamily)